MTLKIVSDNFFIELYKNSWKENDENSNKPYINNNFIDEDNIVGSSSDRL